MKAQKWSPEDISDELADEPELLKYLRLLPRGLWSRHFEKLEQMRTEKPQKGDTTPLIERQINYMLGVVHAREDAIEEHSTNDAFFQDKLRTKESSQAFGDRLRMLLITSGNLLGAGQTARVKSLKIDGREKKIAVKYLLTPTAKTLSASGEHDMLYEVKTELEIEEARLKRGVSDNIHVPQPLFFYKRGKFQCYGMDEIDGMTLEELLDDKNFKDGQDEIFEALSSKFATGASKNALLSEADTFMQAVHDVCLHGDIKLKNIMIARSGRLYLIDFGQSVPLRDMNDKTQEQYENRMVDERGQLRECLQSVLNAMRDRAPEKAAA